jgi:hypothetical protein
MDQYECIEAVRPWVLVLEHLDSSQNFMSQLVIDARSLDVVENFEDRGR